MECLVVKKVNGVAVTEFVPTTQMRTFILSALFDPAQAGKEPEEICEAIGLGKSTYKRFKEFEPYFSEWIERVRLTMGGKSRKKMLEMVGMEKALTGDFQFWKAMAIKEGVISADTLNIGASLPANLGQFKEMSEEQLHAAENSLLASLRGQANPGTIDLTESDGGWGREGDPPGASEVREGPLVLAPELGLDRECPLKDLESF